MNRSLLSALSVLLAAASLRADPQVTSWYTTDSGQYARIYQSTAAETANTKSTTWSRGAGTQTNPTYAGVSEVSYSAAYVYVRTTGLASHTMGPWYLDAAKTQNFPNFPSNTARIYRFPRVPVIPAAKTLTAGGATGYFVNGVALFDMRDTFSYVNASATDATPVNGLTGDGIWNREAYHNEGVTFDAALAHQAGSQYHYHAQAVAVRHQLGDHVTFNSVTKRYEESGTTVTQHSPILAWARDGLPIYGPYGYSAPLDAGSGLRRMICGFVPRDGNNGTTNLATTGRTTLPAWAARVQGRAAALAANQFGPNVNATYAPGHYLEDYDYLGDLGYTHGTHFDLNEQNVRFCITPEFPAGTYAYFTTIAADGTPLYPFNMGRQYFGTASGAEVASIAETVTTHFSGGPNKTMETSNFDTDGEDMELSWNVIEGGTYNVQASTDLINWSTLATSTNHADDTLSYDDLGVVTPANPRRFYQITRTALAIFDGNGFNYNQGGGGTSVAPGGSAARGTTVTVTITLTAPPNIPPLTNMQGNPINAVSATLAGTIVGTNLSRPTQTTVLATFAIPANAPTGLQNIVVVLQGPTVPTYTVSFTIN